MNRMSVFFFTLLFCAVTTLSMAPLCLAAEQMATPSVAYSTHMQNTGWQAAVEDGTVAGTTGESKRIEALTAELDLAGTGLAGGIRYSTHVQNMGWMSVVENGEVSGTEGLSLRVEALTVELTGDIANAYDVCYRVHVQDIGWMGWARNGQQAGTAGLSLRVEAIQILLLPVDEGIPDTGIASATELPYLPACGLQASAHVQDFGDTDVVGADAVIGSTGQSKRIEGIEMDVVIPEGLSLDGSLKYQVHVQNVGWMDWAAAGEFAGTRGQSLRLEAIRVELTGALAEQYNVFYQAHIQNYGWIGWACNGQAAGSTGFSLRMEAVRVVINPKQLAAPGSTSNYVVVQVPTLVGGAATAYCRNAIGSSYSQDNRWASRVYDCSSLAYRAYSETAAQTGFDINALTGFTGRDEPWEVCYSAANQARWIEEHSMAVLEGELRPGDWIFYGGSNNGRYRGIYHVAIYVGGGQQIDAAGDGEPVAAKPFKASNIGLYGRPYLVMYR